MPVSDTLFSARARRRSRSATTATPDLQRLAGSAGDQPVGLRHPGQAVSCLRPALGPPEPPGDDNRQLHLERQCRGHRTPERRSSLPGLVTLPARWPEEVVALMSTASLESDRFSYGARSTLDYSINDNVGLIYITGWQRGGGSANSDADAQASWA